MSGEKFHRFDLLFGVSGILLFFAIESYFFVIERVKTGIAWTVIQYSVIIPIAASIIVYNEIPEPLQFAGIAAILLSMLLFYKKTSDTPGQFSGRDAALLAAASVLSGVTVFINKMYQQTETGHFFNLIAIQNLVAFAVHLIWHRRRGLWTPARVETVTGIVRALSGGITAVAMLKALEFLPGPVVFSIRNTGGIILVPAAALFLFHEKMTVREVAGIVIAAFGIAAVLYH